MKDEARAVHIHLNDGCGRRFIVLSPAHGLRKIILTKLGENSCTVPRRATSNLVFTRANFGRTDFLHASRKFLKLFLTIPFLSSTDGTLVYLLVIN